jgi:hypothetical protein
MKTLSSTHVLRLPEAKYWALVFDRDYNNALYKYVGVKSYKLLELRETPTQILYTSETMPDLSHLPSDIAMLVERYAGYLERGVFDKKTRIYTFRAEAMGGKVVTEGRMMCAVQPGVQGIVRRIDARVNADIPFGGTIEDNILQGLKESWDKGAEFTNRYKRA